MLGRIVRRILANTGRGLLKHWGSLIVLVVVGTALTTTAYWQGLIQIPWIPGSTVSATTLEMNVERLEPTRRGDAVNVILRERRGNRRLVVVVGLPEALAIESDLQNGRPEYSRTYELMRNMVKELGGQVNRIVVSNVTDTTFFAKVVMDSDGRQIEVESRPSDAIALAVRARVPIYAEASVLEKAGVTQATN